MAGNFRSVLTAVGEAKVAASIAGGPDIQIVEIAVGDRGGEPVDVSAVVTSLVNEVHRGDAISLRRSATNESVVIAELAIPHEVGGFTVREVGLIDADGDLLVYGSFPESYKPTPADGAAEELIIRLYAAISSDAIVHLVIDPSIVFATREWVVSQIDIDTRLHRPGLYYFVQF